jgi:crotonobetainyl-CoA:carnitine CoA-transferase CaiB-like acyl-CoA transferase
MPTAPLRFSESRYESAKTSAAYGEHSIEVLTELGLSRDAINALIATKTIGDPTTSPWQ